jgi:hypothetical protein
MTRQAAQKSDAADHSTSALWKKQVRRFGRHRVVVVPKRGELRANPPLGGTKIITAGPRIFAAD